MQKTRIAQAGAVILAGVGLTAAAMFVLPVKDTSHYEAPAEDPARLQVFVVGDQGEGDYRQRRVAALLEARCREAGSEVLVQTVGDNFYSDGVTDIEDPKWQTMFEAMYDTPCLMQTSFYGALGNHDYELSPDAQVDYAITGAGTGRWTMPARFYAYDYGAVEDNLEDDAVEGNGVDKSLVSVVVLDTMQPLEHQIELIEQTFADPGATHWRVVVGHYNIRTYSRKYHEDNDLLKALSSTLQKHKVHFYLSGHSHGLQLIEMPQEPVYVISGGGGASPREMVPGSPDILKLSLQRLGFAAIDLSPTHAVVTFVETSDEFFTTFSVTEHGFVVARACLEAARATDCVLPR